MSQGPRCAPKQLGGGGRSHHKAGLGAGTWISGLMWALPFFVTWSPPSPGPKTQGEQVHTRFVAAPPQRDTSKALLGCPVFFCQRVCPAGLFPLGWKDNSISGWFPGLAAGREHPASAWENSASPTSKRGVSFLPCSSTQVPKKSQVVNGQVEKNHQTG